ncbi:hypothetical protein AKO1_010715 [Acrasis kona]|uniref:ENT domain-containing protein n=1 Tax=Acrasis kona TaxID=1008807 RepID=A0AAW2YPK4_9EUKA
MVSKSDENGDMHSQLRHLETTAYSAVVSAVRAQGELTWEKQKIIDRLRDIFHISSESHHAEVARAEADTLIQQISASVSGHTITPHRDESELKYAKSTDTESESDNEHTKRRASTKGRGSIGGKQPAKKRARKNVKKHEEEPVTTSEPKKKRAKKPTKLEDPHVEEQQPVQPPPPKADSPKPEEEEEDLDSKSNTEIEEIADKEDTEIEELQERLKSTSDPDIRQSIMAALKPKRVRLDKLIEQIQKRNPGN